MTGTEACRPACNPAAHTTGRDFPDAPRRLLAKSVARGTVPFSVCSWESNPWRHARAASSHAKTHTRPHDFTRSMTRANPRNDESRLGGPGGFQENPRKTAYIWLTWSPSAVRAHARAEMPVGHPFAQTKYTTAFMTSVSVRSERDPSSKFSVARASFYLAGQGMTCSPNARSSTQNSTSTSELPKTSQPSFRLFHVPATHFSPLEFAPVNSP